MGGLGVAEPPQAKRGAGHHLCGGSATLAYIYIFFWFFGIFFLKKKKNVLGTFWE
jgi:hypothetical protein